MPLNDKSNKSLRKREYKDVCAKRQRSVDLFKSGLDSEGEHSFGDYVGNEDKNKSSSYITFPNILAMRRSTNQEQVRGLYWKDDSYRKCSRVIFNNRKWLLLKSHKQYKTSKNIDWFFSSLYRAALTKNIKFNPEKNKKMFQEEEIQNIITLINDIRQQDNLHKMIPFFFEKAKNTLRRLLMEIMHPELYVELNKVFRTEAETCGLLKHIQNLLATRKKLIILFIKIFQWNVLYLMNIRIWLIRM